MSSTDLRVAFWEDPHSSSETHASPSGGVDYTVCGEIGDKTGNEQLPQIASETTTIK